MVDVSDLRIAILTFPYRAKSVDTLAVKFAKVTSAISSSVILVSGGITYRALLPDQVTVRDIGVRLHYVRQRSPRWLSILQWILKAIAAEFKMAGVIFRERKNVEIVFCTVGVYYQVPIVVARLLRKKVVSASLGLDSLSARESYGRFAAALVSMLIRFNHALSHRIVIESQRLSESRDLVPFQAKLCKGSLFLSDVDQFHGTTPIRDRENVVGFVGRLAVDKGLRQFLRTIPLVLSKRPDISFMILGEGPLNDVLAEFLQSEPNATRVSWLQWVEHEDISTYMNRMKLVVIPSYSEGLPSMMLEAIACGTPVLATKVGGIPDILEDGKTGFLLEGNSPHEIAHGILRALNTSTLEEITERAGALLKLEFSLEAAVQRYRDVFRL